MVSENEHNETKIIFAIYIYCARESTKTRNELATDIGNIEQLFV